MQAEDSDSLQQRPAADSTLILRSPDRAAFDTPYTAVFRGRELGFRVVDGMAVHAGDMVLGRVEDLAVVSGGAPAALTKRKPGPVRRDLSSRGALYRWPYGKIPYIIDSNVVPEQRESILGAIREWNERTIITLLERTSEADYVRFMYAESGPCRADVGMIGGEQGIYLSPAGCTAASVSHEIGHAVGLFHEHQRVDRDTYVTVLEDNLDKRHRESYTSAHPGDGPYDYASVMHYGLLSHSSNGGYVMETIPLGLVVSRDRWREGKTVTLSQGDIEGVARLYDTPPRIITLTTNPPGLDVVIDGTRLATPIKIPWAEGSEHVIEAPSPQEEGRVRYLFGRWNDALDRVRTVTISMDRTWYEANFILQHRVDARATPKEAGTAEISPASADGFYTLRTPVQAVATASSDSGYQFWQWGSTRWGSHGGSSNPADSVIDRGGMEFIAVFTKHPLYRIESNVDPFIVNVNGDQRFGPTNLVADRPGKAVRLRINEVQSVPRGGLERHRFQGWNDGGSNERHLVLPKRGGSTHAWIVPEFPLSTSAGSDSNGSVHIDPASQDGYYREGSEVRLTASPDAGWHFVRWSGDAKGTDPIITVEMDRARHVQPVFSQASAVDSGESETATVPVMNSPFAGDGAARFRVQPSPDATEISIEFDTRASGADVDMYVNAGSELFLWGYTGDGSTPVFRSDFVSASPGNSERVVIGPDSTPPLDPSATYYVSLVGEGSRSTRGTLRAEIKRDFAPRPRTTASPRAFTFVSPRDAEPVSQTIRLTNDGSGPLPYRIASDRQWLAAVPSSGEVAPGTSVEISVTATPVGIPPDTHWGRLIIERSAPGPRNPSGVHVIPVAYVVTPDSVDGAIDFQR